MCVCLTYNVKYFAFTRFLHEWQVWCVICCVRMKQNCQVTSSCIKHAASVFEKGNYI